MSPTQSDIETGITAAEWAAQLRALADAVEHSGIFDDTCADGILFVRGFWTYYDKDPARAMAEAARAIGGRWEKEQNEDMRQMRLVRRFGPHRIMLFTARENVCERVVVGTETVTREMPDPDAPPVPTITVTEEVERFEWRCSPLLAAAGEEA
ncbi:MAG: hypothetical protein ACYCQK_01860 [Acidiferrobacteraceae bacterium]